MKNQRKKIFSIVLAISLSLSFFSGCKNLDSKNNVSTNTQSSKTNKTTNNSTSKEETNKKECKAIFDNLNEDTNIKKMVASVRKLTSKEFDGRLTGSKGNELATEYIANAFKDFGLDTLNGLNDYKQYYNQNTVALNTAPQLKVVNAQGDSVKEFHYLENFKMYITSNAKVNGTTTNPMYFVESTDLIKRRNKELDNKILLIPHSVRTEMQKYRSLFSTLYTLPNIKGIIYETINNEAEDLDYDFTNPVYVESTGKRKDTSPIICSCDTSTFKELKKSGESENSIFMNIDYAFEEKKVANVVGVIPGTDESLKDECIIISGHFDHIGNNKNGTYNPGASDNASGTAVVLEVARILKLNDIKPKKTIVFAAFNGEENGYFGSYYFTANSPFSIKKTIMLNTDMIANKAENPLSFNYICKTDLIDDLSGYAKELNISFKIYNDSRSDHKPIDEYGGKAVTFIEPEQTEYHTPKDNMDVLEKSDMEEVLKLILYYLSHKAF